MPRSYSRFTLSLSNGAVMPVVKLGDGETPVVTIPGAGDGLATVYDSARRLAWFYRDRAPHQTMHLVSRRENIPADHSIEDHARDYMEALDRLRLTSVILECNSAGGLIGHQIAAQRPDLVRALVLASTAHRLDARATAVVESWLKMIEDRRWADLGWDSTVKTYRRAKQLRWAAPLLRPALGLMSRPKDTQRLEHLLRGLLGVDHTSILQRIESPTLVFGGTRDPIFSGELQRQMADGIRHCRFVQAPGHLHGADLESPLYATSVAQLIHDTAGEQTHE